MGQEARVLWHKDEDLAACECVVLPGGFSYGDYLRCGAIARFSPIMKSVARFAGRRRPGDRNLQRLSDSVRGASAARRADAQSLARPSSASESTLRVENAAHAVHLRRSRRARCCGCRSSTARDSTSRPTRNCAQMEERGQVILRYVDAAGHETRRRESERLDAARSRASPTRRFNVFGLMPHPEHAVEPMLGGEDGLKIFVDHRRARSMSERSGLAGGRADSRPRAGPRARTHRRRVSRRSSDGSGARRPSPSWAFSR